MAKILTTATAIVTLGLASMGSAHARLINYQHRHFHPGYASQTYSRAPSAVPWEFVPGRDIMGESCELPSSACSNDARITG
jgi:hypothetical protein